jgi:hypothetical protein
VIEIGEQKVDLEEMFYSSYDSRSVPQRVFPFLNPNREGPLFSYEDLSGDEEAVRG